MNYDFPIPITSDTDLQIYEDYLKEEFENSDITVTAPTLTEQLKSYIGKPVKAECAVGNRLESRSGILTQVGEEFIILTAFQNRRSMIIGLKSVKFLTILQNNIKNSHF